MTLLAVLAHPDDESFFCGGTLTRYAAEGHDVFLICATKGEQGEVLHPDLEPTLHPKGEARGELRAEELREACKTLGIHPPIFLGYQDSGYPLEFAQQNLLAFMHVAIEEIEAKLLEQIAAIRPDIILTFDPSGFYGHVDHKVIHRAATAAFWSAGKVMQPAPKRLFYPVPLGDERQAVSEDSVAVQIAVRPFEPQIRAALLAHRSQVGADLQMVERDWPRIFAEECFALGGLRGGFPEMPVGDLLEGL